MTLIICAIIGALIIFRNRKLRKNQIKSDLKNDNNVELDNYDDIQNEYEELRYEIMSFNVEYYDFREYDQINYDQLNFEQNKTAEYSEIFK